LISQVPSEPVLCRRRGGWGPNYIGFLINR
jgi:hypothetical protein